MKKQKDVRKGSIKLMLPENLHEEFSSIRRFGNFSRFAMHKYYHYFYSIAVAYSANDINKNSIPKEVLESLKEMKNKGVSAIDSPQLNHHDDFFKVVAYWFKMKLGEEEYYKILTKPDKAREICEMFFKYNWVYFKTEIDNYSSDYPDIQMVSLIEDKLDEKKD